MKHNYQITSLFLLVILLFSIVSFVNVEGSDMSVFEREEVKFYPFNSFSIDLRDFAKLLTGTM
jgi:hypothetical protein